MPTAGRRSGADLGARAQSWLRTIAREAQYVTVGGAAASIIYHSTGDGTWPGRADDRDGQIQDDLLASR